MKSKQYLGVYNWIELERFQLKPIRHHLHCFQHSVLMLQSGYYVFL